MLSVCIRCSGSKKMLAVGNLIKDCEPCSGVGYIDMQDKIVEQKVNNIESAAIQTYKDYIAEQKPKKVKKGG